MNDHMNSEGHRFSTNPKGSGDSERPQPPLADQSGPPETRNAGGPNEAGAGTESEPKPERESEPEVKPGTMPPAVPEPELRDEQGRLYLSREAINAWRIAGSLGSLAYWLIPLGYGAIAMADTGWPVWPSYVLGILFFVYTVLEATIIPYIRWKRWRYQVDHNEIDLQRGLFIVTRTLIPIKRVQHVDTRQGPVYRQFGLASVTITTAGDTHEIPALSEPIADNLRNTISEYARVAREDL
ncbi:PH domain-containing protein [Balneolales bacterium ANBcel1]|nr:PH domain-containing protein [Balneolales bacterium ANBcel1]